MAFGKLALIFYFVTLLVGKSMDFDESFPHPTKKDILMDTPCEKEPRPDCGTGHCEVSEKSPRGFICKCPSGHSQENLLSPCEGVYVGSFGAEHFCKDGISSEDIVAINSRTLKINDFHCESIINCKAYLQNAYFVAHMGTRDLRLKTIHFDQCTGTSLPGLFPATLYLEFPEDWYVDSMYKLTIHDVQNDQKLCVIETSRETRDQLSLLEHPTVLKCHYHGRRVNLGRFGQVNEKCRGHIHSGEIEAVNSRIIKINRFHCDGEFNKCHSLLNGAFFVAKRGKNSVYTKTIVHDICSGFTLPQFQYSFTIFVELPEHWTVDTLSSFLLWDFNTKKVLCRIKIDKEMRSLLSLLPKQRESRCVWEHENLDKDLREKLKN